MIINYIVDYITELKNNKSLRKSLSRGNKKK